MPFRPTRFQGNCTRRCEGGHGQTGRDRYYQTWPSQSSASLTFEKSWKSPLLPGYQAYWWVLPYSQPTGTQHVYLSCQVLHGDPHFHSSGSSQRLVDSAAGSQGRLFACADKPSNWRCLWFALRDQAGELIVYQWKVLPFGLATAPRVFTKLVTPVATHLHLQGCLMYPYINNIFHAQASVNQADSTGDPSLRCHFRLGFITNLQKSALIPSQVMLHLGDLIDTARGLVFPSLARRETIIHAAQALPGLTQVSVLRLWWVTGLMASCHALVPLCMFRLHPLSTLLRDHFNIIVDHPSKLIPLSSPVIQSALEFWPRWELVSQGILLQPSPPTYILTTDASTYGWGRFCGPLMARVIMIERSVFIPYKLSWAGDCYPLLEEIPKVAVWHTCPGSDGQHHSDALNRAGKTRSRCLDWKVQEIIHLVSEHDDYNCRQSLFRDRKMWRHIASLGFEWTTLTDWSAPPNGISTSGWPTYSSIYGADLQ